MSTLAQAGQNQDVWSHFGDTPCQGNMTFSKSRNWGCLGDYVTSLCFLLVAILLVTLEPFLYAETNSRARKRHVEALDDL